MGRTKRIRKRKKTSTGLEPALINEIIPLMKWMRSFNWRNTSKLCCRQFETTGRGVGSRKNLLNGDVLIKVPYELLITYSTISNSVKFRNIFKADSKLGIHDILAAFLVYEKHKKNQSVWKYYLRSLPTSPELPWLSSAKELQNLPADLRKECDKCKFNFVESWTRLRSSFYSNVKCECCGDDIGEIFNLESYTWGYIMVNTRGVYVDPIVVRKFSNWDIIYDEPQIAMLPLLDMFNHSDVAENKIELVETTRGLFYQLSTMNTYKKHDQIFISYGRHDNVKLLFTEYGFYLQRNSNDKIKFTWKEVLSCQSSTLNEHQYAFLKKHDFLDPEELFISSIGPSFKLKGFLFVVGQEYMNNYGMYVFSENYNKGFLQSLERVMERLLEMKVEEYQADYEKFREQHRSNVNVCGFLKHRIYFVEYLKTLIPEWSKPP